MFAGLFLSDTDGTRTRNHRIDSPSSDNELSNEKPVIPSVVKFQESTEESSFCDTELQSWLESCPAELTNDARLAIIFIVKSGRG